MPIISTTMQEYDLVIVTHKGEIPDNEFIDFYWRFFHDKIFSKPIKLLIDLREADSRPRSSSTLRQFADFIKNRFTELNVYPRVAVVAPKSLSFGLARMYQSYSESVPWDFVVFRAIDAALAWLDVPEDLVTGEGEED